MIKIDADTSLRLFPFTPEVIAGRMKAILNSDNKEVNRIINYIIENSGKMIRPRLVLLSSSFYSGPINQVRDVAVAVELIHMASLVHDDIIDRSLLRRGRKSVNGLWGNQVSVLTGDYLFAAAFQLINSYNLQAVMESITETIRIMCAGEIKQMSLAYDVSITEEEYLDKTFGKTACLFAASCRVGALSTSMPPSEITHIEKFGLYLGYAYQILDDVLDFVSDSTVLGKPTGNDLLQGNITLPIIHALSKPEISSWLGSAIEKRKLNANKLQKINRLLLETGSLDYAMDRALSFMERGLESLHQLPPGMPRQQLEELARYLISDFRKMQPVTMTKQEAIE